MDRRRWHVTLAAERLSGPLLSEDEAVGVTDRLGSPTVLSWEPNHVCVSLGVTGDDERPGKAVDLAWARVQRELPGVWSIISVEVVDSCSGSR